MKALYRIINILLGIAVIPCTLYLNFIHFGIKLDIANAAVVDSLSLRRIIAIAMGKDDFSSVLELFSKDKPSFLWPKEFQPLNARLIVFLSFFALMLICALFIIIWSIFSNKKLPVFIASCLGLVSVITMIAVFNSVAGDILSNKVDVIEGLLGSGILSTIAGTALSISRFRLDGFQNADLFIFIGLIVWTAANYLVNFGEKEPENILKK